MVAQRRRRGPNLHPGYYAPDTGRPSYQLAFRNVLLAAAKVTGRCISVRGWAAWAEQYLNARSAVTGAKGAASPRAVLATFCDDCLLSYRREMEAEGRCWRNEAEQRALLGVEA